MNLKSILLGTAASLLITASASYADDSSVVKHSEAKKAVHAKKKHGHKKAEKKAIKASSRACSALGENYIAIPGTSSCVKVYGRIMSDVYSGGTLNSYYIKSKEEKNLAHRTAVETSGRVGFETLTPSSLGNIHSRVEIRAALGNGLAAMESNGASAQNNTTSIHFAYAEIGGLRFGIDESIFNTWTKDFGSVNNDGVLNPFEANTVQAISYKKSFAKGISGILGLESYAYNGANYIWDKNNRVFVTPPKTETPSIIAGVKYENNWGDLIAVGSYEGYYKTFSGRVRADYNISNNLNVFALASIKELKDILNPIENTKTFERLSARSIYGDWDGRWQVVAGSTYKVNPVVAFNAQLGYTAAKTFAASADVCYSLAPGFDFIPEVTYLAWNDDKKTSDGLTNSLKGKHQTQVMLFLSHKF